MDPLLKDVVRGDLASVQARIGVDRSLLNAPVDNYPYYTALTCAAQHGRLHIARYLLGEGAQVNEGDGTGSRALREACYAGRQAMVELLLEAGADAVTPSEYGDTPLMCAARGGHVGIIRALLAHGCGDIDARGNHGRTALWWACGWMKMDAALLLLEAGADMRVANSQGRTPLYWARSMSRWDFVAVLEVSTHTYIGWPKNYDTACPNLHRPEVSTSHLALQCHYRTSSRHAHQTGPRVPLPPGEGPAPPRCHPQPFACRRWSGCRAYVRCEAGAPGVPGTEGGGGGGGGAA
jgi:hypothetical protein